MHISQALEAIDQVMSKAVESDVEVLNDASKHILSAGGKRIRPRILLLSYAATGGTDFEKVLPVAAAVELVHTASVVHDDINDHGMVRRGRPSVNAIWGRTFALLTGDFLFTKVYELMAPYKDLNIILSDATVALVEGETLQAHAAKTGNLSREIYYQIIALKTAALFQAAAHLGGALAQASTEQIASLKTFGYNVGLAFQIIDDILDLTADDEQLGKTAGIDLTQGKGIGSVYAANGTPEATEGVAVAAVDTDDPMAKIKQKILGGDAIEQAQTHARVLVNESLSGLDTLPESSAKSELVRLAHLVIDRDH